MKILFVSGTDTGVGKTLASALLCNSLLNLGYKVSYLKAVQTGAVEENGELISPDKRFVDKFCGAELATFCPFMFKLPASPHLAASLEKRNIHALDIVRYAKNIRRDVCPDYLVIEGAGGLAVPLSDGMVMIEICKLLNAGLIIVTRASLGTLNHTFLSLKFAEHHKLSSGLVISGCSADPDIIETDNIKQVSKMTGDRVLFKIPQFSGVDTDQGQLGNMSQIVLNYEVLKSIIENVDF